MIFKDFVNRFFKLIVDLFTIELEAYFQELKLTVFPQNKKEYTKSK